MVRFWAAPAIGQKTWVEAAVLAMLVLSALLVVRQLHHASAANGISVGHSAAVQSTVLTSVKSSESSVSEDSSASSSDSSNQESTDGSSAASGTNLTVNGRNIPLPANGSVHQTQSDGTTTTTINAQTTSDGQGTASTSNSTSVNVQVNSHSENSQ